MLKLQAFYFRSCCVVISLPGREFDLALLEILKSKKVMMRFGRELKRDNVVTAYDVVMKESIPVLRTFKQTTGVKFWSLAELQNQVKIA